MSRLTKRPCIGGGIGGAIIGCGTTACLASPAAVGVGAAVAVYSGVVALAGAQNLGASLALLAQRGGGGDGAPIPKPGELAGQGRHKGIPENGERGVYEVPINGKWYVGSAFKDDLRTRLIGRVNMGIIKSWDDIVWTELKGSDRSIQIAERVRIEQVAKEVGGRQNMANEPNTNPASKKSVINWFENGWDKKTPDWPNWLRNPWK